MGSVLTEEEVADYALHPFVIQDIETFRTAAGLEKRDFRIVDWGCGRGRAVARLRQLGYDAYGADVDPAELAAAHDLFASWGLDSRTLLRPIEKGRTSFETAFFHFAFSETVLEHVDDIRGLAEELSRVTRAGGVGFHYYPAQWSIIESHIGLPLVHWLPKSGIRYFAIFVLYLLPEPVLAWIRGAIPNYWPRERAAVLRARIAHHWTVTNTHYRSCNVVAAAFRKHGFVAEFAPTDMFPRLGKRPILGQFVNAPLVRRLLDYVFRTFVSVTLKTTRVNNHWGPRSQRLAVQEGNSQPHALRATDT